VARRAEQALARYFAGDTAALSGLPVAPWNAVPATRLEPDERDPGRRDAHLRRASPATSAPARGRWAAPVAANPIPIVIPCHRVVAAQGLGGYSGERGGDWLEKKRWLLTHEGVCT